MKKLEFDADELDKWTKIFSQVKKSNLAKIQAESHLKIEWMHNGCEDIHKNLNDVTWLLMSRREEISDELYKELQDSIFKADIMTFKLIYSISEF